MLSDCSVIISAIIDLLLYQMIFILGATMRTLRDTTFGRDH